jgi:hypothetical protein
MSAFSLVRQLFPIILLLILHSSLFRCLCPFSRPSFFVVTVHAFLAANRPLMFLSADFEIYVGIGISRECHPTALSDPSSTNPKQL